MPPTLTLLRFDSYLGPYRIGNMWTLEKGGKTLACEVTTHPLGWELRVTSGDTFARSQVCKTEAETLSTSEAWLAEATTKGWERA